MSASSKASGSTGPPSQDISSAVAKFTTESLKFMKQNESIAKNLGEGSVLLLDIKEVWDLNELTMSQDVKCFTQLIGSNFQLSTLKEGVEKINKGPWKIDTRFGV